MDAVNLLFGRKNEGLKRGYLGEKRIEREYGWKMI